MPARLTLDLFTPLPPAMTDIANHSAGILPHLGRDADVRVWVAQEEWDLPPIPGVQVRRYNPAALPVAELNGADAAVFNFGNNAAAHREIFEAASRVPGIAVLHDLNLHHFFAGLAADTAGRAAYLGAVRGHHGPEAHAEAEAFLAGTAPFGPLVERYPLTLGVAGRALALVVHNDAGLADLRARTRLPLYHVPLSLVSDGVTEPRRVPARPPYRLIVFGFIGGNRRLDAVLRALAALPDPALFRLDIYGRIDTEAETEALIQALDLRGAVVRHGYVPAETLDRALAQAHLAINLRFPTMGEASGSQLRIWAHALPSLVTRVGWYATLPDDAVSFVDPDREHDDLVRHLAAFHADQEPFLAAGRRGRALVLTTHAPARYARALLDIAAQAGALRRDRAALDLASDAARRMAELMDPVVLRATAPAVARAVASVCGMAPAGSGAV